MSDLFKILDETLLTPAQAAKLCRTTARTIIRWASDGFPLGDGRKVKLEAVRAGRQWLTSREAVHRFVAATTATEPEVPVPQPSANRKWSKSTQDFLDRWGIKT